MEKNIDCLLIGHNDMDFWEYEKIIRRMGVNSCAYRDLKRNVIQFQHRPRHLSDVFNLFYCQHHASGLSITPLSLADNFSAAIAYLGTYLRRQGLTLDFINSFQEEKHELAKKLAKENVLTIAIITTLYFTTFPILEIIRFIKTYNQSAKIVIGGPFINTQLCSFNTREELEYFLSSLPGVDFFVQSSQGEASLVKIINALKYHLSLETINNIHYKTRAGYVSTPHAIENNQLSENMVDWNLFSPRLGEYVCLRSVISCLFSCAYCGHPDIAGKYQAVKVQAIEKELNCLEAIGKVKRVHYIDDTMNVPIKRFKEILRMIIKNNYSFKWNCNLRCQYLDRETVELLKQSGCDGVFLGLESGSNEILKNMNKAAAVEEYLKGIELLKEYEIVTFGSFIIGFPGETPETVRETIHLIENSGLDYYRAHLWYAWTITPIMRQREKYHLTGNNYEWQHETMDSKTASDIIDHMLMNIETSTWVPQYNFDFENIFHLTTRGITPDQVKKFLKAFNQGVKEHLFNPSTREISPEVLRQIRNSSWGERGVDDTTAAAAHNKAVIKKYAAEFDL
jgi:radical SAM PhpK family P-methyltransferase